MNGRAWTILVIVVLLVGAVALYWTRDHVSTVPASQDVIQALFSCDGGKTIGAIFDNPNDVVKLTLSDGRSLSLPRAISANGARYANADESFVFWNVGDTAFITENGTSTFENCVTSS